MKINHIHIFAVSALLLTAAGCDNAEVPTVPAGGTVLEVSGSIRGSGITRSVTNDTFDDEDAIGIIPLSSTGAALGTSDPLAAGVNTKYTYSTEDNAFSCGNFNDGIIFQNTTLYRIIAYYPYIGSKGTVPSVSVNTADQTAGVQSSTLDILRGEGRDNSGAIATYGASNNKAKLVFSHVMSKLILAVTVSDETGFSGEEQSAILSDATFELSGISRTSTYNITTNTFTGTGGAGSITFTGNQPLYSYGASGKNYELLLVPQTVTAARFKITWNDVTYTSPSLAFTLKSGEALTLPVTVRKVGLEIGDVEIVDWSAQNGVAAPDAQ